MGNTSTQLKLNCLQNTRDLGGMIGFGGRHIRKGLLFRSGQLFFADSHDIELLASLGITKVFDFRSNMEHIDKPDFDMPGADNIHIPVIGDFTEGITREKRTDESAVSLLLGAYKSDPDIALKLMIKTYAQLISESTAIEGYEFFLNSVLDNNGAALWHCTAGKDRAGFASILIEEILGVSKEDILEDYLATNIFLKDEICHFVSAIKEKAPIDGIEEHIVPFFSAEKEYFDVLYSYAEEYYGSMLSFINNALHFDNSKIDKMREKYLE